MNEYANRYRAARMAAAEKDKTFSSRERAAARLYVSAEALQDYETGRTVPPCDVVARMVDEYDAPDLRRGHIREYCPLITDYGEDKPREPVGLMGTALRWMLDVNGLPDVARELAEIARDGKITRDEIPVAMMIRARAQDVRQMMDDTIAAIDDGLRREGGGIE